MRVIFFSILDLEREGEREEKKQKGKFNGDDGHT
jgi:hypothetical protein